jgi:hypothetical protein
MSWKDQLGATTAAWHAVESYAQERTQELVAVCVAPESSDQAIRKAQAGILELQRLVSLPQMLQAEKQIRGQQTARKEY